MFTVQGHFVNCKRFSQFHLKSKGKCKINETSFSVFFFTFNENPFPSKSLKGNEDLFETKENKGNDNWKLRVERRNSKSHKQLLQILIFGTTVSNPPKVSFSLNIVSFFLACLPGSSSRAGKIVQKAIVWKMCQKNFEWQSFKKIFEWDCSK